MTVSLSLADDFALEPTDAEMAVKRDQKEAAEASKGAQEIAKVEKEAQEAENKREALAKVEEEYEAAGGVKDEAPSKAEAYTKALDVFKNVKQEYKDATEELTLSLDSLLKVPKASIARLEETLKGGSDTLVVFYAPWCPHCQTFVLHDAKGNPLNAPLEVLRRDLAPANIQVLRADAEQLGIQNVPSKFDVQAYPTVFFVNQTGSEGRPIRFSGNPHNTTHLFDFIKKQQSHTASLSRLPSIESFKSDTIVHMLA
jgi:thiol-disulfide isomerase/thioredoxin